MALFLSDFDYSVDPSRIALEPSNPRSQAKLLVYHRGQESIQHSQFLHLREYLRPGDLLVFNSSQVLKARFHCRKAGKELEGIFIPDNSTFTKIWLRGQVKAGDYLEFEGLGLVRIYERDDREVVLEKSPADFLAWLQSHGLVPLPPYIRRERERQGYPEERSLDAKAYSTVFEQKGSSYSVAAPTASLHFDEALLESLQQSGILSTQMKLHVGLGTFEPLQTENLDEHSMHHELVEMSLETQNQIEQVKARGGRVIAVGTTVMRSLESLARQNQTEKTDIVYTTDLFIKPPFEFQIVDGLITNLHWPKSTLLVLVATFLEAQSGKCPVELRHLWRSVYQEAEANDYQYFSYGDGMLIL